MVPKQKLKRRRSFDRRKKLDRRNGLDRRLNSGQVLVDEDLILNTKEACQYLKISRPTYLKYITTGKIRAKKVGRGWRVLKSELNRFLNEK